jgi:hypothetical protein
MRGSKAAKECSGDAGVPSVYEGVCRWFRVLRYTKERAGRDLRAGLLMMTEYEEVCR